MVGGDQKIMRNVQGSIYVSKRAFMIDIKL